VKRVLRNVSFTVHAGQKVGVVGANGAGKSSLLALLAGRHACDDGDIERAGGQRTAEVEQDITAVHRSLLDFVLDGNTALRDVEAQLARAEAAEDGDAQARALGLFDDLGGYTAETEARRILGGLGFPTARHDEPLTSFSGGWRVRAALARALAQPADMLLLDEPTNHLDLDAVLWLEDWIRASPAMVLLVSHDREFLDSVVDRVVHVHGGNATLYTGNYSAFEAARAEALAQQGRAYERQQQEVARIQRFVERFRYKATKARQAQSRLKTLERMERIAPAHVDAPFQFAIPSAEKMPDRLLRLDDVVAGYGGERVLDRVNMAIGPGQRMGILGRNGAGKSTLVKMMAGTLSPQAGDRDAHRDLQVGYFAQHQMEQLRDDESALAQVQRRAGLGERQGRDLLGRYGFSGDDVLRPVATFSGGERARLVLALIFQARPNLLLLDEPTNHLDLDMRHALSMALQDFPGAIVLVSHDRHLLETTADELWLVRHGTVAPFDGDLEEYARWLRRNQSGASEHADDRATTTAVKSVAPKRERKLSYKEQRELAGLPGQIELLEKEQAALHRQLGDPAFYQEEGTRIAEVKARLDVVEQDLDGAFTRWSELEELQGAA
jgi:ATP-binding cassette subfamily F protein 3